MHRKWLNDTLLKISNIAAQNYFADKEINIKVRDSSNSVSNNPNLKYSNEDNLIYSKHKLVEDTNNLAINTKKN